MRYARPDAVALAAVLLLVAGPAAGQEIAWPEAAYNRAPAEGDLVLPMPCGGAMTFRAVDVPGTGIFDDHEISLGGRDADRAIVEYTRPGFVAGTFSLEGASRYFLGKYEVTEAQYTALRGDCQDASKAQASVPQVDLTFAEAALAAETYTGWLLENAPDMLPAENDTLGHLRLPTEEEWEYAARGGIAVGPANFDGRLPPMDGPPEQYMVFCRTDCALELAGLLRPNPLGLHDMMGNAAELVHGVFRLSNVGRENGSAGGFIKRGGSYLTRLEQLHSGLREEFTPLAKRGLRREDSTGFRLTIVAPALPDRERLEEARRLWTELAGPEKAELGAERADPRAEVGTLAEFVRQLTIDEAPEIARRLTALGDVIDVTIASRNKERARSAREMLRVAVIAARRLPAHQASMGRCEKLLALDAETYRDRCERIAADSAFDHEFYLDHLSRMAREFPPGLVPEQAAVLEQEFGTRLRNALECLPVVVSNIASVRIEGIEVKEAIVESVWQSCGG